MKFNLIFTAVLYLFLTNAVGGSLTIGSDLLDSTCKFSKKKTVRFNYETKLNQAGLWYSSGCASSRNECVKEILKDAAHRKRALHPTYKKKLHTYCNKKFSK